MLCEDPWKGKRAMLWMLIRIVVVHYSSPHSSPVSDHILLPLPMATSYPLTPSARFDGIMSRTIMSPAPPSGPEAAGTNAGSSPPKAHLLKRVLSAGSSGSASVSTPREALATPPAYHTPLSPNSGGNRTPKAKKASLAAENGVAIGGQTDGKIQPLVTDMDGLQVQSPIQKPMKLQNGVNGRAKMASPHTRAGSSSTDSSSTGYHPSAGAYLGSSYGPDGFPSEDSPYAMAIDSDTAARIAFTDEAVKSINGTSTVFRGSSPTAPVPNPYSIPRTFSHFVQPHQQRQDRSPDVSRQSSTSSAATEASTSSEESDLCVPTIEWVNRSVNGQAPQRVLSPKPRKSSPGRMAPPPNRSSPRRQIQPNSILPPHLSSQLGASTSGPSAPSSSEVTDSSEQEEDDAATVGHARERSPSASSVSAESGLDLLWKAATSQGGTPTDSPDTRGKRKVGTAEAVKQWRNSGIPNGSEVKTTGPSAASGPPKKRRRSENVLEEVETVPVTLKVEEIAEEAMDEGSGSDQPASDHDSEYGGKPRARVISKSGRGGGKKARGGRVSTGTTTSNGTAARAGGGGGKKGKKIVQADEGEDDDADEDGSGGGGGRRGSNGAGGIGVQCEYVNPLPVSNDCTLKTRGSSADCGLQPYNRCQDVFTRKYDLPRHMARHARREGELVHEGRLAEDKALLWKTIKDKPKVTCNQCGEMFTR